MRTVEFKGQKYFTSGLGTRLVRAVLSEGEKYIKESFKDCGNRPTCLFDGKEFITAKIITDMVEDLLGSHDSQIRAMYDGQSRHSPITIMTPDGPYVPVEEHRPELEA